MKSGLEDRNNTPQPPTHTQPNNVSMKSGLEDRNNDSEHDQLLAHGWTSQ